MKSNPLSTSNSLNWNSPLYSLAKRKVPKNLEKLNSNGIKTFYDLLWLFPLRLQIAPKVMGFSHMHTDELFLGKCKLINIQLTPSYGRRGKSNLQLFNASVVVQDVIGDGILTLKWFNTYPNFKNQIESHDEFYILGSVTEFKGQKQIINPQINPKDIAGDDDMLVEYPTVNTVAGPQIKKIFEQIPQTLWNTPIESLTSDFEKELKLSPLHNAFNILHGKEVSKSSKNAKNRIIYEEFFINQLKVLARKLKNKNLKAPSLICSDKQLEEFSKIFPYELTDDQKKVLNEVKIDIEKTFPMMRMIQGDVGCGKTSVALIAAMISHQNSKQTALMCPTEALGRQHFETFTSLVGDQMNISLLLGSTKPKDRKIILNELQTGKTDLIIGTHSLIQDSVEFKDLGLAIIDEQHKFGVAQRQTLTGKGTGVHTLIMSATPIPRTLQLAQYGDLDISTIRSIPSGRKGTKTRIVTTETYHKYLSFIKTRVEMGEQIYIVVPAIEESETLNVNNVEQLHIEYKKYFPDYQITALHGQLKSAEKTKVMNEFTKGEIQILISTTVIEVGINVLNSTVMAIYNPDRFGLSSLHQLRGRVGRGEKPGFCFLVTEKNISPEVMQRLKVIENSNDGFEIADADLKNRGEGELFGTGQSGYRSEYKLASIFENFDIFEKVSQDINKLKLKQTEKLNNILLQLTEDTKVTSTI